MTLAERTDVGRQTAPPAPHPRRRRAGAGRPWLLLAPALLVMGGLLLYPLVRVLVLSLQDFGLRELVSGRTKWVGLDNYADLLGNADLWTTVLPNTVVFAVVAVALTVVLGTLVALLLARLTPLVRGLVTTAIMVAWAMPAVTGTYVWVFVFAPVDGIAVQALDALGLVDAATANPFAGRLTFYAVATLNVVHHGFPFVALTVLAGLLTIPRELTEAAIMDGASAWRRFWSLTFPMLRPVFAVVTVLSTIWDFKVFTQIYLMPGGDGVNRGVLTLGTWSYVESFAQNRYGLGAAIAVLLTAMLLVITVAYLRLLFREEEL
jgi:N,N'-diacetylchitobiose transport system permease protein